MRHDDRKPEGLAAEDSSAGVGERLFLLLPGLAAAPRCRLPIDARAAAQAATALLGDSPDVRRQQWRAALGESAPLALWAACGFAHSQAADMPPTLGALADWLELHALTMLRRASDQPADCVRLSASQVQRYAETASRAVSLALISATIARSREADAELAHLCGLLHGAAAWIALAGEIAGEPVEASNGLPPWLLAELADVSSARKGKRRSAHAACVQQALESLSGKSRGQGAALDWNANDRQMQLMRGWLDSNATPVSLSRLAEKLARLEQLESEFQRMLEHEKIESLKELAYGAGHEINNPLANISVRAQTLLKEEQDPERRRQLAAINSQVFRAHEMIADLMLFARPPQLALAELDWREFIQNLVQDLAPLAAQQQTELSFQPPAEAVVAPADRAQLAVALRALCLNSLEALGSGGRIDVSLKRVVQTDQTFGDVPLRAAGEDPVRAIHLIVSDDGPGIAPEIRRHMFDPFYSGREAGRGLGFGLPKCWRIVTDHGGRIEVESAAGGGVRFVLTFPG